MSKVIYSMGVSLDGFIAGPGGEIAVVPDEELHASTTSKRAGSVCTCTGSASTR